jgi:hypothetical protein
MSYCSHSTPASIENKQISILAIFEIFIIMEPLLIQNKYLISYFSLIAIFLKWI